MTTNDNSRDALWREELRKAHTPKERKAIPRVVMPQLDPAYRITCNEEVNCGLSAEQARLEAVRCMDCPDPQCITGCPVQIDIPGFVKNIERGEFITAAHVIKRTSALPAVCGRVCPQEKQCESRCIYNRMHQPPVAIGYLERFAADYEMSADMASQEAIAENEVTPAAPSEGKRVAVVGSGPAGLTFAADMIRRGYRVTVFEALHLLGGVLRYGIPEFRLPNTIVDREIENLRRQGVKFVRNCVVGKTLRPEDMLAAPELGGFDGIFVASGAGLPRFMGIPGENLIGVLSSNEYLTRVNLMGAGRPGHDTPVWHGKNVAVIGGGNTAMDSVRTALRMGAEKAYIVYRRTEAEMPARIEEVHHAKEEGVTILELSNPIEYISDGAGHVRSILMQRMELGEPDASGRRSPVAIEGDTYTLDADMVIVSVGVSPNPLIPATFTGIESTRRGTIAVDTDTMQSSVPTIFAGGDIVRGGATVILAMGDGRLAAKSMHEYLSK